MPEVDRIGIKSDLRHHTCNSSSRLSNHRPGHQETETDHQQMGSRSFRDSISKKRNSVLPCYSHEPGIGDRRFYNGTHPHARISPERLP